MGNTILKPKTDIVFKLLFGSETSTEILTDFLMAVLNLSPDEYDEVAITNPILLQEYKEDKLGILDVRLKLKSGKIIHVEIQVQPTKFMKERILFYDAKLITDQIGESDKYSKIKRVISIVITDYILINESLKYHHCFKLHDPENNVTFTDLFEIHTLEIPKIGESDSTPLWNWMKFLDVKTEEELRMIAVKNPVIEKAAMRVLELSADEKARMLYEDRLKAQRDRWARDEYVEDMATAKAQQAFAIKLLQRNRPIDEIVEDTGLSYEEVEALRYNP